MNENLNKIKKCRENATAWEDLPDPMRSAAERADADAGSAGTGTGGADAGTGVGRADAGKAGTGAGSAGGTGRKGFADVRSDAASDDLPYKIKDKWGMPKGFPSKPLGANGNYLYFLNSLGQVLTYRAGELNAAVCRALAGDQAQNLEVYFPKWVSDGDGGTKIKKNDFDAARMLATLTAACFKKSQEFGIFDPNGSVRSVGAWRGDDDELIYHFGNEVWFVDKSGRCAKEKGGSEVGGYVYTSAPALSKPSEKAQNGDLEFIRAFFDDLKTWNWRNDYAPALFLGYLAGSSFGGALKWRPAIWITGTQQTGKSTLIERVMKGVLGKNVITCGIYTEAFVRQSIGGSHLPVALDECETDQDPEKLKQLIILARSSVSGSTAGRGGQDHNAVNFELKSSFSFSSIIVPPLSVADVERIAILSLDPLMNEYEPDFSSARLKRVGEIILRRVIDHWRQFETVLNDFATLFKEKSSKSRIGDVYGTMLAFYKIVTTDDFDMNESDYALVDAIYDKVQSDFDESGSVPENCAKFLMGTEVRKWTSGSTTTVGDLVVLAATDSSSQADTANEELMKIGLKVTEFKDELGARKVLFVAGSGHPQMLKIFENTDWRGAPGKTAGWTQALRYFKGARPSGKNERLGGWQGKGTYIDLNCLGVGHDVH